MQHYECSTDQPRDGREGPGGRIELESRLVNAARARARARTESAGRETAQAFIPVSMYIAHLQEASVGAVLFDCSVLRSNASTHSI